MAAEVNKELNNIIECCICAEIFTDPRILPCIHTFCVKCLTETGSKTMKGPGDQMSCPLCRTEFTIPKDGFTGLKKNFFMDKLVEVVQLSKQNVCDSNKGNCTSAKWFCNTCKQALCDECSTEHKKAHSQEADDLVPFENQREVKKPLELSYQVFCDKHKEEELKIFCNDCQLAKCALCFLESHQSHKWSPVKEVAKKFRAQIASNAVLLSDYVPEAQNKIEQLEHRNVEFLKIVHQVESEVNKKQIEFRALFDKIMQEDIRSLISTLTSYDRARSERSKIEKEDLDGHLTKLNSYIMFCNDIAANGSDVDICRVVNETNSTAKELKDLHGTVIQRNSGEFHLLFEERTAEDFLKTFNGNMLGKIEATNLKNENSQHQQKSSMVYSLRNHQFTWPRTTLNVSESLNVRAPNFVVQRHSSRMSSTKVSESLNVRAPNFVVQRPSSRMSSTVVSESLNVRAPNFVVQRPSSRMSSTVVSESLKFGSTNFVVQRPSSRMSSTVMPGSASPPLPYATLSQMQQQNAQQLQMYQQSPLVSRFQFPKPIHSMTPLSMPKMQQEMPTEAVAPLAMHVGEPAQRPPFIPRPQRSDIVYYDPSKADNDVDETASHASKPKAKNVLTIIDPNTGQNVLENLEMSSRQTSNEALKHQIEFVQNVRQLLSSGNKTANLTSEGNKSEEPLYGARPKTLLTTSPAASLSDKQRDAAGKTEQEKSEQDVQDKAKAMTHLLIPIPKQWQVHKEEKPSLVVDKLQMEQEESTVPVPNLDQSKTKTGNSHISATKPLENMEKTKPNKGTIYPRNCPQRERAPSRPTRRIHGRITYDREFLLQLRDIPESRKAPLGFPDFPEIVRVQKEDSITKT